MINNKKTFALVTGLLSLLFVFGLVGTASAEATSSPAVSKEVTKANQEIDKRVTALNELSTKVNGMQKVSDAQKSAIATQVQTEISNLNALKAKIAAETDKAELKKDIQSITGGFRIFALVIPQGLTLVAADRISTITDSLTALAGKFETRLAEATAAGKDVTAIQKNLDDMKAKISDAKVQAAAAVSGISALVPDEGDKTKLADNTKALKQARADIKVGMQDIKTAQQDAKAIAKALKKLNLNATSTAASASTTSAQ